MSKRIYVAWIRDDEATERQEELFTRQTLAYAWLLREAKALLPTIGGDILSRIEDADDESVAAAHRRDLETFQTVCALARSRGMTAEGRVKALAPALELGDYVVGVYGANLWSEMPRYRRST